MYENTSSFRSGQVQSAGDIMRQMGVPAKPVDYVTGLVTSRKSLSGNSRYSYCPFCVQRAKSARQDYKAVCKPLQVVTYKNLYRVNQQGDCKIIWEREYECTSCKEMNGQPRKISMDDFISAYAEKETRVDTVWVNEGDFEGLKKAGFSLFAENRARGL